MIDFALLVGLCLLAAVLIWGMWQWRQRRLFHLFCDAAPGGVYGEWLGTDRAYISDNLHALLHLDASQKSSFVTLLHALSLSKTVQAHIDDIRSGKEDLMHAQHSTTIAGKRVVFYLVGQRSYNGRLMVLWLMDITSYAERNQALARKQSNMEELLGCYRNVLDSVPFPMWQRDTLSRIAYGNKAYMDLLKQGEEMGQVLAARAEDAEYQGKLITQKKHVVLDDGTRRLIRFAELPSEQDTSRVGYALFEDKQEALQDELKRHISAQRELLEASSSAIAVYGRSTELLYYNQAFVTLWDMDEAFLNQSPRYGEILEQLRMKRCLPEQADFKAYRQSQLDLFSNLVEPLDDFLYLPDGTSLRVIVIPHALGGLLFAYEDMTDKLALERSYNTLIAVQKETIDHLNEGVIVLGQDGMVHLHNKHFLLLWGMKKDMLRHAHINEVVQYMKPHFALDKEWSKFEKLVQGRQDKRILRRQRIQLKKQVYYDATWIPLPDGGELISFMDVSDSIAMEYSLKERNAMLHQMDKVKTQFLGHVSYELRTPLTSIMGFAQALSSEGVGALNAQQKEYLADIHTASCALKESIDSILDVTSITAGHASLEKKHITLYRLLSDLVTELYAQDTKWKRHLVLECPKRVGSIKGDRLRMQQALRDLFLSFAALIDQKNASFIIKAYKEESALVVLCAEKKALKQGTEIFAPTMMTESGLGFTLSKAIIELHGGTIEWLKNKQGELAVKAVIK